jgi:hypothetical protein
MIFSILQINKLRNKELFKIKTEERVWIQAQASQQEGACLTFTLYHPSSGLKYTFNLIKSDIPVNGFHGLVDKREFDHIKILSNIIKPREEF